MPRTAAPPRSPLAFSAAAWPFSVDREPMITSSPARAKRRASPNPSSPVPPMMAMVTAAQDRSRGLAQDDGPIGAPALDGPVRPGDGPELGQHRLDHLRPAAVLDAPQDRDGPRLDLRDG